MNLDRRTLLKGTGAVGTGLLAPGLGAAAVDPALDTETDTLQEVIVLFRDRDDVDRLDRFDLVDGYYKYKALPMGYTRLTGEQIRQVASWPETINVEKNHELSPDNEDAREVTGAKFVQDDMFYTGETVHAAVIDSGIDGDHPDIQNSLQNHFRFVNPLSGSDPMWTEVGPANTGGSGHGTHVSGSLAGEGTASDGQYRGMAPDADLTVYSTTGGYFLFQLTGAYDDLVHRQREGRLDVQVVNNSYSSTNGGNYSPFGVLQVATWEAYKLGITSVFSAGNAYDPNTLSDYSIGPHILCSAATDDQMYVTDFSSKGRRPEFEGAVNYNRKEAVENVSNLFDSFNTDNKLVEQSWSGTIGPAADTVVGPQVENPVYHEWTAPTASDTADGADGVGFITATLGWQPDGQDVDLYVWEGTEADVQNGNATQIGSSTQPSGSNPEVVKAAVTPGTVYTFEVAPWANVAAQYDLGVEGFEETGADVSRPYSLHRPSVGTPGKFVMSAMAPEDYLQGYPTIWYSQGAVIQISEGEDPSDLQRLREEQSEQAAQPYYGQVSGTSMSGPVLAGLVALVYDAYNQNVGEFPDPMDVITTIEATAKATRAKDPEDGRWPHRTWSIGAGFADIKAAVERAAAGDLYTIDEYDTVVDLAGDDPTDVDETLFSVTGSRDDAASVFTAGQIIRVELTVDATMTATVRDRIPFEWTVVAPTADTDGVDVYTEAGNRYIEISEVTTPSDDGEAATVDYYLEAPAETGQYEFGPGAAKPYDTEGAYQTFTGAETNTVVGVDTADPG